MLSYYSLETNTGLAPKLTSTFPGIKRLCFEGFLKMALSNSMTFPPHHTDILNSGYAFKMTY